MATIALRSSRSVSCTQAPLLFLLLCLTTAGAPAAPDAALPRTSFSSQRCAASAGQEKIRGLRLDPGRLYTLPGYEPDTIAERIVGDLAANNFNTLFIFAYNPVYGAFYSTGYRDLVVEPGLGARDIVRQLLDKAHARNIKVVLSVPINNFRVVWQNHPEWRVKRRDGHDYQPDRETFLLSAQHHEFRNWYDGFVGDLLTRYPDLDGIEAVEAVVAKRSRDAVDYNAVAIKKFSGLYPNAAPAGKRWLSFRAQGITELHGIAALNVHRSGKQMFVVQTWTPRADGSLADHTSIGDSSGFDFEAIMNLRPQARPDYIAAELIWQQWRAETLRTIFTPEWTRRAARDFVRRANCRVRPLVHVELTPFPVSRTGRRITPTTEGFRTSVRHALEQSAGVTIYDYTLLRASQTDNPVKPLFAP